ncbi:hypothetical protein [Microbacterium elymi]|uniref:SHOCT domain-containing protein n=1 Tax=Microbacterium elymi TaxID=2909587 RepID=A0ABY5NKZ0_9MICO|nr:hypothetical protein [Microbacterium elymi]UUT35822.1 hypothetical protein L2X98_21835 [Microbacterium elymi]
MDRLAARGARWSPLLLGLAVIAAVLAGFATAGIPRVSARDDFAFGAWIVPVWVTLVLGGVLAIGILLRVRVRTPEPTATAATAAPAVSDRERARTLVRALPSSEQGALQADRDDALRILAGRGLIDDATLERALGTDLGTLFTLDPIREG